MPLNDIDFIPVDREIMLETNRAVTIKHTIDGIIEYVNGYYTEVTGYEVHEIVGSNIADLRHPDIPQTIQNYITAHIKDGKNVNILLKGKAKDGRYYWYITNFEYKISDAGTVDSVVNQQVIAPRILVMELEILYEKVLKIEKHSGLDNAKMYFEGFNEEKGMSFNDYTRYLATRQRS